MTASPFQQPYLASNDNRTIAGINCPTCHAPHRAVQFKDMPAKQAVKIIIESDLSIRTAETEKLAYGDPEKLPEELQGNPLITYWRCEACGVVFHRAFKDFLPRDFERQIYNAQFLRTLPQLKTEFPELLARVIHKLFQQHIKNLNILSCENNMLPVSKSLATMGVTAEAYAPLNSRKKNTKLNKYDLVCAYALLERSLNPADELAKLFALCGQDGAIFLSHYAFDLRDPKQQAVLSPRSGLIQLHSQKSFDLALQAMNIKSHRITPTATLLYRQKLPHYAEHLQQTKFSAEELVREISPEEAEEQDENHQSFSTEPEVKAAPTPIEVNTDRISIRDTRFGKAAYNHHDQLVGTALNQYGEYLVGDQELLTQLIRPDWIVFEAAANIGLHCMMIAPMLSGGGHIHAFEPYRDSYRLLGTNLLLNNLDNVSTYRYALGSFPGVTRLVPVDSDAPGSMVSKGWAAHYDGAEVPLNSLDSLEPDQCHFLHVCAPECEPVILQGAQKTLSRFQPALLVNCVNEADFQAIFRILSDLGYRMYWHIQPFYLRENFFNNPDNEFGSAGAAKILALHSSKEQNVGLSEIENEDDWIG